MLCQTLMTKFPLALESPSSGRAPAALRLASRSQAEPPLPSAAALSPCPFVQRAGGISLSGCWEVSAAVSSGAEGCRCQCQRGHGCRSPRFGAGLALLAKGKSGWVQVVRNVPLGDFSGRKSILAFPF